MAQPIFSSSWYRVAAIKPRLRSHAQIHRHQYRGETWYMLQDLSSERHLRFSPPAYFIVGQMDGQRTLEEIWHDGCNQLADDAPTQDETIQLLSQLYRADVLQCDVPADAAELLERHEQHAQNQTRSRIFSIFSWRFPLLDPERFLDFFTPLMRPIFGWIGALVWLVVVVPAGVLAATHWSDLTMNFLDRLLLPQNLLLVWLVFPVIKTFHEFGHAFAAKAFGGEVHDMGVMLLVLTPVPYVDASAVTSFRQKWRRVFVGAAGMIVELFIAALAFYIWINAEPGTVRTLAYNAILIAGVSTILFNANPLLRYDGYYILSDFIEIPNLRSRANAYLGYLCERYLFGNPDSETPPESVGERRWFVAYGVLSFIYRSFVVVAILFYLAERLFNLGALIAVIAALAWAAIPVVKGFNYLFTSPKIRTVRSRAVAVTLAIFIVIVGLLTLMPVPYRTLAEGVIWIPEESFVRAGTEGFVARIVAPPGSRVRKGDLLVELSDPTQSAREQMVIARVHELEARYQQHLFDDRPKAEVVRQELRYAQDQLMRARQQAGDLKIRSQIDGVFVVPIAEDLPGRFVRQGEQVGYVLQLGSVTVRTIVSQATIDLVRSRTRQVQVRLSERMSETIPAQIRRMVPGASEKLPARALGSVGGGALATDPSDRHGLTAVQKVFQIDVELPLRASVINLGGHGYVRFDHGWTPLAVQWYRSVRQLFLSRLNV